MKPFDGSEFFTEETKRMAGNEKKRVNAIKLIKHKYQIQIINKQSPAWKYVTQDAAKTESLFNPRQL